VVVLPLFLFRKTFNSLVNLSTTSAFILILDRMGAGRKTETVVLQKKPPPQWNSNTNPYSARNLSKKDLAGVIFGCKHSTYKECMSKRLFGELSMSCMRTEGFGYSIRKCGTLTQVR